MPLPYIPFVNCAEAVLIGNLSDQEVVITLGFHRAAGIAASDLEDLCDDLDSWYGTALRTSLTASINFTTIKATDLTTISSPIFEKAVTPPQAGALAVPVAPSNVCAVVKFTTANRGRSFRGRNYIAGLPASFLESPGQFGSSAVAEIVSHYVALNGFITAHGFEHVVLSRFNAGARRTVGVATRVTAYSMRKPIGTQRRRVPGVGI